MIIRVMRMKRLMGLLIAMASVLPLSAQTELTAELVWQEGMHWVYPYEIYTDFSNELFCNPLNISYDVN